MHGMLPPDHVVPNPDQLLEITSKDMCKVLCMFVMEVKNDNGDDYNWDTLYDLMVMVQSFLKKNGRLCKFFEDDDFFDLKNTIDNWMKELSKQGKIAPREKAQPISVAEEKKFWMDGILGDDTPEKTG